jgi:alkylhydroperoxidase family enzyme
MYDRLFGDKDPVEDPGTLSGTPGNWWTVYALVPDIFEHAANGFSIFSTGRTIKPSLRELGQIRAAWTRGSRFVFSQHCKAGRRAGLTEEQIAAIPYWPVADCFAPLERAILAYSDAITLQGGRVAQEVIDALREGLSDEEILELTYVTAMYEMHATVCRALRLEYDDVDDTIEEVAAPEGVDADLYAQIALQKDEAK